MINAGDLIENPVTGERVRFIETARETDGEYVLIDVEVDPNGAVAKGHVHPYQTEQFEIVDGTMGFKAGGKTVLAGPGDVVTVEPGKPHRFWNAGDTVARFHCEVRPALGFESFLETMFGLAADGKTNASGMPNPLRLAVIANEHFDDVRLPYVPAFLQKAALATGATLGRLAGYTPTYPPTPTSVEPEPVLAGV